MVDWVLWMIMFCFSIFMIGVSSKKITKLVNEEREILSILNNKVEELIKKDEFSLIEKPVNESNLDEYTKQELIASFKTIVDNVHLVNTLIRNNQTELSSILEKIDVDLESLIKKEVKRNPHLKEWYSTKDKLIETFPDGIMKLDGIEFPIEASYNMLEYFHSKYM